MAKRAFTALAAEPDNDLRGETSGMLWDLRTSPGAQQTEIQDPDEGAVFRSRGTLLEMSSIRRSADEARRVREDYQANYSATRIANRIFLNACVNHGTELQSYYDESLNFMENLNGQL